MSHHAAKTNRPRALVVPMQPRSPDEAHRVSTPLELLFDLVFVVAVAQAASGLHHGIAEGHWGEAVVSYGMVFFAIWWAWMNFTWFATAYDTDDIPYRLAVFVQLTGALILAAGVPQAFEGRDYAIVTVGYIVMRLALVAQWLRAARSDPAHRATAYRQALSIGVLQVGWVALLFAPALWKMAGFFLLVAGELAAPIWAQWNRAAPWHPHHIAERYGLFTIIVLGESILSASFAIQSELQAGTPGMALLTIVFGGLLIVLGMWWLYFERPQRRSPSLRMAFVQGYGHLIIFASAAAVGAGLAVGVDHATDHAEIGTVAAGAALAVPVALFLFSLWALHHQRGMGQPWLLPAVAGLVLLTPLSGQAALLAGLLIAALLAIVVVGSHRAGAQPRRTV